MQQSESTQNPRDGTRGAKRRHRRRKIEGEMSDTGCHTASQIEQQEPESTKALFERPAQQPERPHVDGEMPPARMHERIGDEGKYIRRFEAVCSAESNLRIPGRHQRVMHDELFGEIGRQSNFQKKYRHVGNDQPDNGTRHFA